MGKLFVLLNIIPIILTALVLFNYYSVIDGVCSRYPDENPKICPLLGHTGHSIEKPEMTALKAGDSFPEGIEFKYIFHITSLPLHTY